MTRKIKKLKLTFLVEMTSVKGQCWSVSWVLGSRKRIPFLFSAKINSLHMGFASSGLSSDQTRFTAKKLLPKSGHEDRTTKNCAFTWLGVIPATVGHADWTRATH